MQCTRARQDAERPVCQDRDLRLLAVGSVEARPRVPETRDWPTAPEPLRPHSRNSDSLGASRFYGTQEQIEAFIAAEDTQNIIQRAGLLLENFGFRRFVTGDALAEIVGAYGQLVSTL